jgi:hypothetical protein
MGNQQVDFSMCCGEQQKLGKDMSLSSPQDDKLAKGGHKHERGNSDMDAKFSKLKESRQQIKDQIESCMDSSFQIEQKLVNHVRSQSQMSGKSKSMYSAGDIEN